MSANDGGPAFPDPRWDEDMGHIGAGQSGMSLRDYFATQAPLGDHAVGLVSRALLKMGDDGAAHDFDVVVAIVARFSYQYADAMLAEREK